MLFDPALRMGRALSFCCKDKLPLAGSLDMCLEDTELSHEACCCATSVNAHINMTWHMPEKTIVYSMVAEA